jgi:hypothetical protein
MSKKVVPNPVLVSLVGYSPSLRGTLEVKYRIKVLKGAHPFIII